jgi:hypothetical protein
MTSRGDGEIPRQEPERAKDRTSFVAMLKEQFRQLAQFLTPREAPTPQPAPRRRRREETRGGFNLAARQIMRRAVKIPAAAYAAVAYLSDTLDWLNLWHQADQLHDDFEPSQPQHLYPHL